MGIHFADCPRSHMSLPQLPSGQLSTMSLKMGLASERSHGQGHEVSRGQPGRDMCLK